MKSEKSKNVTALRSKSLLMERLKALAWKSKDRVARRKMLRSLSLLSTWTKRKRTSQPMSLNRKLATKKMPRANGVDGVDDAAVGVIVMVARPLPATKPAEITTTRKKSPSHPKLKAQNKIVSKQRIRTTTSEGHAVPEVAVTASHLTL